MKNCNNIKIYCLITGGLGNQLFQISKLLDMIASIEVTNLNVNFLVSYEATKNEPEPAVFELINFEEIGLRFKVFYLKGYRKRLIHLILRMKLINSKLIVKNRSEICYGILNFIISSFGKIIKLRIIGDNNSYIGLSTKHTNLLTGYFQDHSHTNEMVRLFPQIVDKKFAKFLEFDDKNGFDVAVHLRLGDYVKFSKELGVLSKEYYDSLLIKIFGIASHNQKLFIFTNDVSQSSDILSSKVFKNSVILSPQELSTIETLLWMSKSKIFIMANSSLSWWAARLKINKELVAYCPYPWFRTEYFSESLYDDEWIKTESYWATFDYRDQYEH